VIEIAKKREEMEAERAKVAGALQQATQRVTECREMLQRQDGYLMALRDMEASEGADNGQAEESAVEAVEELIAQE
jgi:Skp family chaperone for outer membrane proteins